ncbi:unnamed protein product [Arabis nemorensis]|uniref:Uncharacterized protein n=1 Tax=Arabis nemorensis TaxID=586526 RepID=A0A565BSQ6_9BRAS|nr:unnamed protein product [Arabis nemorensis]
MSVNSPPLSPWSRPFEAGPSRTSPYLDDFDDLEDGQSLLGRKVIHSPGSDAGSPTHLVSRDVTADEVYDEAGNVKSEREDNMKTEIDAPVMRIPKKKRKPRVRPDPPGSTLSTRQSLRDIHARFKISKEINEASVGSKWLDKILTEWGTRAPKRLVKFPEDTNSLHDAFIARRCRWRKHFSFQRVERARAQQVGSTLLGSSPPSNRTGSSAPISPRLTLRDKLKLAKKEKAEVARHTEEQHTEERQLFKVDAKAEVARPFRFRTTLLLTGFLPPASVRESRTRYESTRTPRLAAASLVRHEETSHKDKSRKRGTDSRREFHSEERAFKEPRRHSSDRGMAAFDLDQTAPTALSRITLSGIRFPPPDTLECNGKYAEMARHGIQFIAHLNKMVLDYEAQSRASRRRFENVQRDTEKYKGEASVATKRSTDLESEARQLREGKRGLISARCRRKKRTYLLPTPAISRG